MHFYKQVSFLLETLQGINIICLLVSLLVLLSFWWVLPKYIGLKIADELVPPFKFHAVCDNNECF
jgi:hypothetical protein